MKAHIIWIASDKPRLDKSGLEIIEGYITNSFDDIDKFIFGNFSDKNNHVAGVFAEKVREALESNDLPELNYDVKCVEVISYKHSPFSFKK